MRTKCAKIQINHYDIYLNGKRIIFLAMMALFCMVDISAMAQCGPQPEGGCTECGPHWGTWGGDCPSIKTNGSVSPTSMAQCGVTGPTMPTNIVAPVYSPTNIWQQTGTYDCSTNVSTNTENITYSVGSVQWDPPLPGTITGTFSSTAYVNVTSSDTTNCPSPGQVNLGTVTWTLPCPIFTGCTASGPPAGTYGAT
jgi:hypothetical protein